MSLIGNAPQDVQGAIDNIMDTFGGADGGISFVRLCNLIDRLSENPDNPNVVNLFNVILSFSRLIDAANGKMK